MDEATTHGDEPLATLLHCDVEVQALLSTLAEPVTNNDKLLVVKNTLAQLLHQLRMAPHVTTDICAQHGGEGRLLQCIQDNVQHSILVCFCFVIIRRLCSVSDVALDTFLSQDVLGVVANVMVLCPQDAVLQASACGVLATFARGAGLDRMLQLQLAQLILTVLLLHQPLNHYSRQVHYYACEVLLRLADTSDKRVLALMSAVDATNGSTAMHLLVILLRQGHQHEDQKVACAACTLVLCLAAKDRKCAEVLRATEALTDISTVMAKYPNDNGISHYSTVATREIALATIKTNGPTKVHEKAAAILSTSSTTAAPSSHTAVMAPSSSKKQLLKPPTPTKKSQAFSRNSIAPAPKLSANVNASLSKMQVMARMTSPLGNAASTVVASNPVRTPLKPSSPDRLVKHHRFIPFEDKLEWRLLQATPKKTVPMPSPSARTVERENILMQTYGVSTLREMHFPPSKAAYAKEKSSPKTKPATPQSPRTSSPPKTFGSPAVSVRSSPRPPKVQPTRVAQEPSTVVAKPASGRPPKELPRAARQPIVKYKVQIDAKPTTTETTRAPKSTTKKKLKTLTVRQQSLQKINHQEILDQRAMNQLAAQLFHEPASPVLTPTSAETKPPETGRRSFSDKLHEMIRTAEEALCRPPSATNVLAVRAATPPSLQFSAAEIPPKPTTPKPPVVPKPATPEPDTFSVAGLGRRGSNSSSSSNMLEMRRNSMERRASIQSDRRKSLDRGLSNAELHPASHPDLHPTSNNAESQPTSSDSGQDLQGYVASLDLKPVLHPMDAFGTSRSAPAMAQEPTIPTDRTAVSEHPMHLDMETPRFDAELELLHNDDMPESARESEDGAKDEGATLEDNVAVAGASASGGTETVLDTSAPDDDGDYNDDEFEEAVNESGDASEPPVDADACAPEVDHDTPRSGTSVDELDSQPLADVDEPPTDVIEPPADVDEPLADVDEPLADVDKALEVDETVPGGSKQNEVPAAASVHQESEAEYTCDDSAVNSASVLESTETPTTERDTAESTDEQAGGSLTQPDIAATDPKVEPSRAGFDAPVVEPESVSSEANVDDSSSEKATGVHATPRSDLQGVPAEPSDAASGDDKYAPCTDDPVPAPTASIEANPALLEATTEVVAEGTDVAPNDASDLAPREMTAESVTESIDVPAPEAGVSDSQRIDVDAQAADDDTKVASDVVARAPVATVLAVDTPSNLPPEIEYEEEVWADDIEDGDVTATTSDAVSIPSFDDTPAPKSSAGSDPSTDAAVCGQDGIAHEDNAATHAHDMAPSVLASVGTVSPNDRNPDSALSEAAPVPRDASLLTSDDAPVAVETIITNPPSPRAESAEISTPRFEPVDVAPAGVIPNDADGAPLVAPDSPLNAEAPTHVVVSAANTEPTTDVWEGDEYVPNDAAVDEVLAGLVDDYDKASSTASLADNPRFDSEFEVDDSAAPTTSEPEAPTVVAVVDPPLTAREPASESAASPEPVVLESVEKATPPLVDDPALVSEPSTPLVTNRMDEAETTSLQAGGEHTLSTTSLDETERFESDFEPVDDVVVPSNVVTETGSLQNPEELELLAVSTDVAAPKLEAAQEVTKSSNASDEAPALQLQPTSSTASLEDSTRFESDFEADDAPPDANVAPVQEVATLLEKESPMNVPSSTPEPPETAESELLPSATTTTSAAAEMPSSDAITADPVEDTVPRPTPSVTPDHCEYEEEYFAEYDDAPVTPDVARASTDAEVDAAADPMAPVEMPPLTLPTPRDEEASQDETARSPQHHPGVASEPALADLPTPRPTTDAGAINFEPINATASIKATIIPSSTSATDDAVHNDVSAPPPCVSADPVLKAVASPRAVAPPDAEDAVPELSASARVDDSTPSSVTSDTLPSARPVDVPALALLSPSLDSAATKVSLPSQTNVPTTTPRPPPESSRIPAPPTTNDDVQADDDDDDNAYADDDDYGDDDFED
ncbi:hypothetical protein SDRG_02975 [Saprolegnia diclina VS20]|uniref:Uncharacterized protein n=1 Tax=Saprolegnia diclina (strain VS20) TaxID=1156394 RepID=T0S3D5_SAPDV|nr:hypothetical protein SDRG_02975 [Saprolegnia diclina VS20]EQC39538.1 hypothetical protein SDRG_02975 [Saprolegnia diclina VS20]|eukprot:XP_008606810.1 hypothetical protein SDRG_02975 [Saprolegnia diclina VS20]